MWDILHNDVKSQEGCDVESLVYIVSSAWRVSPPSMSVSCILQDGVSNVVTFISFKTLNWEE